MRFDFEWEAAPGVRDRVLAATWARLSITVDDLAIVEAIDLSANARRTGIYGSLFPLAEWLVEHWWHLLHEPSPRTPPPGGRAAPVVLRAWMQRHNLLTARDGGALPDLTIARDGSGVILHWEPDPATTTPARLRFVGQGTHRVATGELERAIASLVEGVLTRLREQVGEDEDVSRLAEAWNAIRSADTAERVLCQSLAVLGTDPYDPDEASDALVETVERAIANLSADLRHDLLEGSEPMSLGPNLRWIERESGNLGSVAAGAGYPTIETIDASTPHESGYLAARRVRSELLGLTPDEPIPDLDAVFVSRLGWASECARNAADGARLDGMIGLHQTTAEPLLVTADVRSPAAARFRLARAAYFPVTQNFGAGARLLTSAVTPPQRAARAFAAELLAPSSALRRRVSGRLNGQDLEALAREFQVNPQLIQHQIENHGLGIVEVWIA